MRLSIEPVGDTSPEAMRKGMEEAKKFREQLFQKYGYFPDTTRNCRGSDARWLTLSWTAVLR